MSRLPVILLILLVFFFFCSLIFRGQSQPKDKLSKDFNTDPQARLDARRDEIKKKIQEYGACREIGDCEAVESKCPFGCYVAVNKDKVEEMRTALRDYPDECANVCRLQKGTVCEDNKCKILF